MKIFNKEKDENVVYLQQKNLKAIINYEGNTPQSLLNLYKSLKLTDMDETHDEEFIRITDALAIDFLLQIDWIPDFRDINELSDKDLKEQLEAERSQLHAMRQLYEAMPLEKKQKNPHFTAQHAKKAHAVNDLSTYFRTRQGKAESPVVLPLALDYMARTIESHSGLHIGQSLDKKQILIETQDNVPLQNINPCEISIAIIIYNSQTEVFQKNAEGKVNIDISIDPTNRYIVAENVPTFNNDLVQIVQEETAKQQPQQKTAQKKKSIFKNLFKPKKKDEN